jgi:hypothetical protein
MVVAVIVVLVIVVLVIVVLVITVVMTVVVVLVLVDVIVHPRRERQSDQQSLRAEDAGRRLAPGLFVHVAEDTMSGRRHLRHRRPDCLG